MAVRHYLAVIERAADGYGVFFPDLPGCTSAGDDVDEALINAADALAMHIELASEHNEPIPEPTFVLKVKVDPDINEVARALLPAHVPGPGQRFDITMDEALLDYVDRAAATHGLTRSTYLAEAARLLLREQGHGTPGS
jgi:predicted RNase H-like HicB family nuclease